MFLMDSLTRVLFYVFLVGTMLGIGVKVGKDEILSVIQDKSWLVRVFVVNFLVIPIVGILTAKFLPMKPEDGLALIVLACSPGGMSTLQFLSKKKEPAALAYGGGTTVLLSFFAIFISPFLIGLAIPKGMTLTVPYGNAILFVLLFMLLPLLLGMFIHETAKAADGKLAGIVALIGTLAFIGMMVKLLTLTKWAKGEMGQVGLISIVVFILVSMFIGWVFGGPREFTRPVLATASSMRNIALALALAIRSFDMAVLAPLVAFVAVMVPLNLLYTIISKVTGKKKGTAAALPQMN